MTLRKAGLSHCPTLSGGGTVGQGRRGRRETAGTSGTNGTDCPKVLIPFRPPRGPLVEASGGDQRQIGRDDPAVVRLHDIGRRVGDGQWMVSRAALAMWLDGDRKALAAYLAGERDRPMVSVYFERAGLQHGTWFSQEHSFAL